MASGVMRGALECQERMDGRYGSRVRGANTNLGPAGTSGGFVSDLGAARRHDG